MCRAQNWKSTGDKKELVNRMVTESKRMLQGHEGLVSLITSKIGPKLGGVGPAAQLRLFYASHFQALDRFDRVWYEMRFHIRPRDWQSHFCWSLLHAAVINARTVWCAVHGQYVPILEFLRHLVDAYVLSRAA
jgi:hypothetical protein